MSERLALTDPRSRPWQRSCRAAAVQVPWIPALQKDTRARNAHSSTAIEGNPLTLEQVRANLAATIGRRGGV